MLNQDSRQAYLLFTQNGQLIIIRVVDVVVAAFLLLLGLPIWICIALAIRINSPGAVIYKQTRIGMNGRPFKMYKFRSMYQNAEQVLTALLAFNQAQGPI